MSNVITGTKTVNTSLIALRSMAPSSVVISNVIDVSTKFAGTVFAHFGRRSTTAAGAGLNLRIEASDAATLDGHWYPLIVFTTAFAATSSVTPGAASAAAGQNIITAPSTNVSIGSLMYIDDPTIANAEWARVKQVASLSFGIEDNLLFVHPSTAIGYNAAEMYQAQIDLSAIGRIRLVADGSLYTQSCAIESYLTTLDSILFT